MKACIRLILSLMLLIALASPARAHADYESVMTILMDANGATYTIVSHYSDGIVGSDPVRLEVRDANGRTVAETQYVREVVLDRTADGTVYAFAVDQDHTFWRGWTIDAGRLVATPISPRTVGLALRAHLTTHWLGYGFSTAISVLGILLYIRRVRTKQTSWRVEPPAITYCAFVWLLLVFLHGNQSLLIIAGLASVGTVPIILWSRRPSEPK